MKKTLTLIILSMMMTSALYAQPSAEEYVSGQVTLPDNTSVTGTIKDNVRKKGELLMTVDGKKTKYKAGDISSAQVGAAKYITWNYTFYEILWQGKNLTLLRKANQPAAVQYVGTEAVTVNSEGSVDDLFVRENGNASLTLFTKKNAKEVLAKFCSSCATSLDAVNFSPETAKSAVEACDRCK